MLVVNLGACWFGVFNLIPLDSIATGTMIAMPNCIMPFQGKVAGDGTEKDVQHPNRLNGRVPGRVLDYFGVTEIVESTWLAMVLSVWYSLC